MKVKFIWVIIMRSVSMICPHRKIRESSNDMSWKKQNLNEKNELNDLNKTR